MTMGLSLHGLDFWDIPNPPLNFSQNTLLRDSELSPCVSLDSLASQGFGLRDFMKLQDFFLQPSVFQFLNSLIHYHVLSCDQRSRLNHDFGLHDSALSIFQLVGPLRYQNTSQLSSLQLHQIRWFGIVRLPLRMNLSHWL
jgi:hypothetical protein